MRIKDKAILILLTTFLFLIFLYFVKSILFPFIAAIIIAYFLNPLADKMEKYKFSRIAATLIILEVFMSVVIVVFIFSFPLLYDQAISLVSSIPSYIDSLVHNIYPKIFDFLISNGFEVEPNIKDYLSGHSVAAFANSSKDILAKVMQSGIVLLNIISLVFITPVLVFYILRDWNMIIDKIDGYLPTKYRDSVRDVVIKIDATLSSCIRGQFNVCSILGFFYAVGLTLSGLNFGFLIGFLTGLLSFIPYVGMLFGVIVAIIVGFFQWGIDPVQLGIVGTIFLVGQIMESNFLTPKLVGDKIGVHPVWIMFGLFVFGVLFGFVGILLALPLTAIIGVLVKFSAMKYKNNFISNSKSQL
ncbi:MAG: putative PurR-regulated permease PerM [Rickettsiales bacterium]|jgi:predicted PurR-regulated permease PerM